MTDRVTIYDTTLRDGCQGTGISLSLHDKLAIARKLDDFGVDYIEGGWPGANPKDAQFFTAVRQEGLQRARVSAFGSTRHAGVRAEDDEGLRLLLDAETPAVAIVAKAWDFHVDDVLRTTLDENVAIVSESVAYLKANGREVVLDAAPPALILERHGSLGVDDVRELAAKHGFSLVLGEKAHERLPLRDDVAVQT